MKIHALWSLPHYAEHIQAVWRHLPDGLRGEHRSGPRASDRGWDRSDLVMVGGFYDIERVRTCRIVYVEHGAGQSYQGVSGPKTWAYHGTDRHPERVVAYIAPRQDVADSWDRPAFAAGAPVCDTHPLAADGDQPVATMTFHWQCRTCPETYSALGHYAERLPDIVDKLYRDGYEVVGHHHPRDQVLPKMWKNLGIPIVPVGWVRQCVDLLIADNTSLMYEMSYLCRSVIALNAPWFRRDVEHGLRFWSHIPGPQVDGPDELLDMDLTTHARPPVPHPSVSYVYGKMFSDGGDGLRAAAWLTMRAAEL